MNFKHEGNCLKQLNSMRVDPGPCLPVAAATLEEGESDTLEERLQKQLLEKDQIQPGELEEREEQMKGELSEQISQEEFSDTEEASGKETEESFKRERWF